MPKEIKFSQEAMHNLLLMRQSGADLDHCAEKLGCSKQAVVHKLSKLGLSTSYKPKLNGRDFTTLETDANEYTYQRVEPLPAGHAITWGAIQLHNAPYTQRTV